MSAAYPTFGAGDKFVEEVESGDRKRALLALRKHVAERISEGVAARDLAALSRQLRDITKELEALGAVDDDQDELAQRRAAVLSAAGGERATPRGKPRAASS